MNITADTSAAPFDYAQGNLSASIESLWHSHHEPLLRYMRRRAPADMAEDLVQEVYLSALEAMHRGKGYTDNARGWLFRIAHNLVIDKYRRRDRAPECIDLDATRDGVDADEHHTTMGEVIADNGPALCDQVETKIMVEEVGRAMATLTKEQRQMIVYALHGYDYQSIAEITGKQRGAVKAQYRRGIVSLQTRFGVIPVQDRERPSTRTPRTLAIQRCVTKRKSKETPVVALVHELLLERGPMLPSDVAQILDRRASNIYKLFTRNEQFAVVGYAYVEKNRSRASVWGIKGVHEVAA